MSRQRYLLFGEPFIGPEECEEVMACIASRWLGSGPRVARLQEMFRDYVGAPAAVAVNSGTAALHLALRQLRLDPGSEVITTAMTFCATANAIPKRSRARSPRGPGRWCRCTSPAAPAT
jgi:dTDP-4-amino-4,6-dideoxygalactose transaminase